MSRRPLLISHRTHMGTHPENTLGGIRAAIEAGVDGIEVDVRASREGTAVLLHDAAFARTTGDPRILAETTAASARRLRVLGPGGEPGEDGVPALGAALAEVHGRCILVVEVKERGLGTEIARRIRAARAEQWCWAWSFNIQAVEEARAAMPGVPASLLVAPGTSVSTAIASAIRAGCAGVSLHGSLVDDATVDFAHRRGLAVYTWTVNDAKRAREIVAADVDAICGDFPARLAPIVRATVRPSARRVDQALNGALSRP